MSREELLYSKGVLANTQGGPLHPILACIREDDGAFGYTLAQIVGPYVSKASCLMLFRPSASRFWGKPTPPLPPSAGEATAPLDGLLLDEDLLWPSDGELAQEPAS